MKKSLLILGVMVLMGLFGCIKKNIDTDFGIEGTDGLGQKAKCNETDIVSFEYRYNGSIGADSYSYSVKQNEEGQYVFAFEGMQYDLYGELSTEVDQKFVDDLKKLYADYEIYRWNGFSKYATDVLDGDGFTLYMKFSDEEYLSCNGSNAYPDGYHNFKHALDSFFESLKESLVEEKKQEFINTGITGNLNHMMVHFKQQGNSGRDRYDLFITSSKYRENNFDVTIESVSGEFIEPGEYRYYCHVEENDIHFERFNELLKKYEIIRWFDYDESDPDYNNCEWFQIDFGFDEGNDISAYGTKHPENYDEFREEYLKLLFETIKELEYSGKIELYQ